VLKPLGHCTTGKCEVLVLNTQPQKTQTECGYLVLAYLALLICGASPAYAAKIFFTRNSQDGALHLLSWLSGWISASSSASKTLPLLDMYTRSLPKGEGIFLWRLSFDERGVVSPADFNPTLRVGHAYLEQQMTPQKDRIQGVLGASDIAEYVTIASKKK
jgi:hypothetical protein